MRIFSAFSGGFQQFIKSSTSFQKQNKENKTQLEKETEILTGRTHTHTHTKGLKKGKKTESQP